MHFLGLLVGVLGAGAFWWYRLKMMGDAASEIADMAGRAKGAYRRKKIRSANQESPIAAIEDPLTACAVLLYHVLENPQTTPAQDTFVQDLLTPLADATTVLEASVYGRWAANQDVEPRRATRLLCDKLNDWLNPDEKRDIEAMVSALAGSDLFHVSTDKVGASFKRLELSVNA